MNEQASIQSYPAALAAGLPEFATGRDTRAHPLRTVGIAALCLGVAALAAATFVLSYSGIHTVAKQAGISARYASDYPLLIDAMLVIALLAVLALRGAGLPSRFLAWFTLLAVLCAAAGADTLHATGRTLPHNVGAAIAAALPWALVLIAFLLLVAVLRHARLRRHAGVARRLPTAPGRDAGRTDARRQVAARPEPLPVRVPQPWNSVSIVPGFGGQLVSSAAAGAAAGAASEPESVSQSPDPDAPRAGPDVNDSDRGPDAAGYSGSATQTLANLPAEVGSQPPGTPGQPIEPAPEHAVTEAADTAKAEDTSAAPGYPRSAADDNAATPGLALAESGSIDEEAAGANDVTAPSADTGHSGVAGAGPADQPTTDPAPADQPTTDPAPADEPTTDPAPADQPTTDPAPADQHTTDPAPADQPTTDPAPADQHTTDPAPADQPTTDDVAAEPQPDSMAANQEPGDLRTADQDSSDPMADDMPVFHRMWSTPTPPDN